MLFLTLLISIFIAFPRKLVDKIDKNKNGNISEDELTEWVTYISKKEAIDATKERLQEYYSELMKDDGLISWEEFLSVNFPGLIEGTVYKNSVNAICLMPLKLTVAKYQT